MFTDFIRDFLQVFFFGFLGLFYSQPSGISGFNWYGGVFGAFRQLFAIDQYIDVVNKYQAMAQMETGQWIGAWAIVIVVILALLAIVIVGLYFLIRFFKRLFGSKVLNQDLVDEIGNLKGQIVKLTREKDRILGLKIGYQGYDVLEGNFSCFIHADQFFINADRRRPGRQSKHKRPVFFVIIDLISNIMSRPKAHFFIIILNNNTHFLLLRGLVCGVS